MHRQRRGSFRVPRIRPKLSTGSERLKPVALTPCGGESEKKRRQGKGGWKWFAMQICLAPNGSSPYKRKKRWVKFSQSAQAVREPSSRRPPARVGLPNRPGGFRKFHPAVASTEAEGEREALTSAVDDQEVTRRGLFGAFVVALEPGGEERNGREERGRRGRRGPRYRRRDAARSRERRCRPGTLPPPEEGDSMGHLGCAQPLGAGSNPPGSLHSGSTKIPKPGAGMSSSAGCTSQSIGAVGWGKPAAAPHTLGK